MVSLAEKNDYLKKYLSKEDSDKKKKKKKSKKSHGQGLSIEEDSAFVTVASGPSLNQGRQSGLGSDESDVEVEVLKTSKKGGGFITSSFQTVESSVVVKSVKKEPIDPSQVTIKQEQPYYSDDENQGNDVPKRNRQRNDSPDASPPRRRQRNDSPDASPPRRRQRNDSPDASPPRRRQRNDSPDASPPRRRKRNDSPDASPPRRRRNDSPDASPPRRNRQRNDSPDASPPRRNRPIKQEMSPPAHKTQRNRHQSPDASPPRRRQQEASPEQNQSRRRRHDSGEDDVSEKRVKKEASPEQRRRRRHDSEDSPSAHRQQNKEASPEQNQPRKKRLTREQEMTNKRESVKQREIDQKYAAVSRGVAQEEERQKKMKEMEITVQETFSRNKDDESMNSLLKEQLMGEDDPMNEYMSKKNMKIKMKSEHVYPVYNGHFPPNRYNLTPGYRWDGVDRSNGFESKMSLYANKKKAQESEAYRAIAELQE